MGTTDHCLHVLDRGLKMMYGILQQNWPLMEEDPRTRGILLRTLLSWALQHALFAAWQDQRSHQLPMLRFISIMEVLG